MVGADSQEQPMWTDENRARYDRSGLRYPSDLTDEEWALVAPEIPPAKRGGNKRTVDAREVVNGLMYVLSTGCQWRAIPKDLPPRSTVNHYFCRWQHDGTLARLHHALYVRCREQAERAASPTAGIIDSQSVKSGEKDAMGRAARVRHHRRCQATDGEPHVSCLRPEPVPHRL
jgi:transposase